jgi:hypothetical protein
LSKPLAAPPDVIRWVSRSGDHGDCAIAALAVACGVSYEVSLQACVAVVPAALQDGMRWLGIRKAARHLGYAVQTLPFERIHLDDDETTGILEVEPIQRGAKEWHVVYVWAGRIVEPKFDRQELWEDPEQFLNHYGYRVSRLLVLTPKEGK